MKLRVFKNVSKNGKVYYSIPATNYKDKNDKITYFVSFVKDCGDPITQTEVSKSGKQYDFADIDVLEMAFGCFNKNPQLSVFKYTQVMGNKEKKWSNEPTINNETIDSDELPFY